MRVLDRVTIPVLGPLQIIRWLGRRMAELAGTKPYDEIRLVSEIIRLQARYDMGQVSTERFYRRHKALIRRANLIRRNGGDAS